MRRGVFRLASRLPALSGAGTGVPALLEASGNALLSAQSGGGGAAPVAAAAAAAFARQRPFSAAAAEAVQAQPAAADDDSPAASEAKLIPEPAMAALKRCTTLADVRSWQAAQAEAGALDSAHLSALIRHLGMEHGIPWHEKRAYLRELLTAAAGGGVQADSRLAAYLLWGACKCQLRGSDPEVQAVLPLVWQHLDSTKENDFATLLWALGLLKIRLSRAEMDRLLARLEAEVPTMPLKELNAAAIGITRLTGRDLPAPLAAAMVAGFEAQLRQGGKAALPPRQLDRIVKVLPHLPGLDGRSPLVRTVFERAVPAVRHLKVYTLSNLVWAAGKLNYRFRDADLEAVLDEAEVKLAEGDGMLAFSILDGLALMGYQAGKGPVTRQLVGVCMEAQAESARRHRAKQSKALVPTISKAVLVATKLRATVPEATLQELLGLLEEAGLERLEKPWLLQMGFRRLRFQPGVDALEPYVGEKPGHKRAGADAERQQQQPAGEE